MRNEAFAATNRISQQYEAQGFPDGFRYTLNLHSTEVLKRKLSKAEREMEYELRRGLRAQQGVSQSPEYSYPRHMALKSEVAAIKHILAERFALSVESAA